MMRAHAIWLAALLLLAAAADDVRAQPATTLAPTVAQASPQGEGAEDADPADDAEDEPEPAPQPPARPQPRAQPAQPQRQLPPGMRSRPQAAQAPAVPPRAARPTPAPAATAPTDSNGVPPLGELTATRERPLFSSTRRPPVPPEEAEPNAPVTEAKSMSFELVGVVRSADSAFAILRNTESKEETRVPKGEKFGAWRVEEIHDRSVVLAGDAKRVRMRLFDESKAPGIQVRRVGGEDAQASSPDDGDAVDEEVEPNASPESRQPTAQPTRRVRGQNLTPAQRRKIRLQQQQQRRRNPDE
jgi:hypothetical protein